jgi:RimJ/RimL family protein N-acetyltransferase
VSSVSVRVAVVADAAAIAAVRVASWRAAYVGLMPQSHLDSLSEFEFAERWSGRLSSPPDPRYGVWVAEAGGAVVAFLAAGPSRDDEADKAEVAEVYTVYALPSAWGAGAGRALMQTGIEYLRAQGFREATLWVLTENARSRRFYEIAGFRPDGATRIEERFGDAHSTRYRMVL